ncbi:hypothetical protein N7512_003387 [Penicillium capsulatum]|nr:hypothetical protein N7512_003387 [Penicillium capsulatum]
MKFTTTFVFLASAALLTAATIPSPGGGELESREAKNGYLEWRRGGDGKIFLLSRCELLTDSRDNIAEGNGRMIPKKDDEPADQRMCWVTDNGFDRYQQKNDEEAPEFDNDKFSCLVNTLTGSDDRHYHGGCWKNNDP